MTEEVDFWTCWLAGKTEDGEDGVMAELPSEHAKVRILGGGAGPVAALGDRWDGHSEEWVPVGPLAETFDKILETNGLDHSSTRFGVVRRWFGT